MAIRKHLSFLIFTLWGFATSASAMLWTREDAILVELRSAYEAESQAGWIAACMQDSVAGMGWTCAYAGHYALLTVALAAVSTAIFCYHITPSFFKFSAWRWVVTGFASVLTMGGMWFFVQGMEYLDVLLAMAVFVIVSMVWSWRSFTPSFRRWGLAYVALQSVIWGFFLIGSYQLSAHERRTYDSQTYQLHREQARQMAQKSAAWKKRWTGKSTPFEASTFGL